MNVPEPTTAKLVDKKTAAYEKQQAEVEEEICHSGDTGPAAYIAHHAENVELFMDAGAAMYVRNG